MNKYTKNIDKLLESFVDEGTYDKDYDIPSEKEISGGGMITLYRCAHASQIDSIFKNGYNRSFCASNDGTWYGDGVYCNITLRQAIIGCRTLDPSREEGRKYGSTIVSNKLIGGYDRFLIFDEDKAKNKYGSKWKIEDQVKALFGEDADRVWRDMQYIMSISPSAKILYRGRTSQLLQDMFHNRRGRISRFEYDKIFKKHNIRGAIYTGGNDGLCAVVYDFSAVIPYATTTDYANTWKRKFNMDEFLHRMATKIDVNQRFDNDKRFEKVYRPIETIDSDGNIVSYSMVKKRNGKYNYIEPKTGKEIFPFDFDSLTSFNSEGECQVEYNGIFYKACVEGFLNDEDNEWHTWDDFDTMSLNEIRNLIKRLINESIDEAGFGKFDIPTEEELDNSKFPCLYHVAKERDLESIFKTGLHPDFLGNHGDVYGRGVYTSIDPRYSRKILGDWYGHIIIKCKVIGGFEGFIGFCKEAQYFLYGREMSVRSQLHKYLPNDKAETVYRNIGGENGSHRLQEVCKRMGITEIRGAIYNWYIGSGDFIAALPFDFSCLIPYSVSKDGGYKFVKMFNQDTANLIQRSVDPEFRYMDSKFAGKYSKIWKSIEVPVFNEEGDKIGVTGYCLVKKRSNNKYNYIDIHTDEEVFPIDFDSLTSFNSEGICDAEYNGKFYKACVEGFLNDEDNEWHTWDDFPK